MLLCSDNNPYFKKYISGKNRTVMWKDKDMGYVYKFVFNIGKERSNAINSTIIKETIIEINDVLITIKQ